jgi:S-formylglutathione hydrolase FrmB
VRKQVIVYLPPSYSREPQRRYPVAYYLHGLGGSEMQWTRDILLHLVMDSLVNAGVPEMIVVMPDGDNGWYTSWAAPADYEACRIEEADSARADAFCVRTGRYDDYVAHDLVRFVDGKYRTQASRAHRAVGGLSMGGYGAMALAFEYPETFAAAASHSGALSLLYTGPHPFEGTPYWRRDRGPFDPEFIGWQALAFGPDTASWWARDPVRRLDLMLAKNGPNARGAVPALFADVGTEDGIADQSRVFKWALEKRGIPITYHEWPGRHDFAYWRAHVGESLSWIAARIGTKD